ncbi:MAG TPA: GNAT family N-acetyltransferase [Bacteroidota bacterium]|nr:GNAT family N-acetyltransferase [Bacteroidota bacterium]
MADLYLSRVEIGHVPDVLHYDDRTIYQTKEWLEFIARTHHAEPVKAVVCDGKQIIGMFSGLVMKKFGVRILGSPFPGWSTSYMGFNLDSSVPRGRVLNGLEQFAFRELHCMHLEIMDRYLRAEDYERAGYSYRMYCGYEIDLTQTEEQLFNAMDPARRRSMRKSIKEGVQIQIATDLSFVDEYYAQLKDVFAKRKLVPTYSKERVMIMLQHIMPTGRALLLKALDNTGRCIATGIFLGLNDTMYFWGGASWREHQHHRPNEALQWFAMRYWKAKNIAKYDMGGGGEYKRKYGGYEIAIPWGRKSKYPLIETVRRSAQSIFKLKQHVVGFILDVEKHDGSPHNPY